MTDCTGEDDVRRLGEEAVADRIEVFLTNAEKLVETAKKKPGKDFRQKIIDTQAQRDKRTALMSAALGGQTKIAEKLLELGARTDITEEDGWVVLFCSDRFYSTNRG